MALEIERKFLVKSAQFKNEASKVINITQGFLSSNKKAVVRIRTQNDAAFITIKGLSNKSGTTRYEWEKEIDLNEANDLLKLCPIRPILKKRYLVNYKNHIFEIDEFLGDNKGLVIAEIELKKEDEAFEKPQWLGEEVTGIAKYYNVMLNKNPFKKWDSK